MPTDSSNPSAASSSDQALYVDPIAQRYASAEMQALFSPRRRAREWRRLWIALARAQSELGLPVTPEQVAELEAKIDDIDFARVAEHEKRLRHDVMAHIHAYGEVAPGARGILHLGATSCFVTDNGDLTIIREALSVVRDRLLRFIHTLAEFARREAERPTVGLTHLQPAQLTTVGKRATLWLQDFVIAYEAVDRAIETIPFRGIKGPTGTQASFLQLFDGNADKVAELDRRVAQAMGFERVFPVTGQTYPRIWDYRVLSALGEIAVAAHKFSSDLRLLQSWGEIEEPFEEKQIGSSAMPHKRNPMRAERMGALAKLLLGVAPVVGTMAATQWFERTLDDSALRRVAIPQGFLTTDAVLIIGRNVADRMQVHPAMAEQRVARELPFLAAEEVMMAGVRSGGDRQDLHERLRVLAWRASEVVRKGEPNPLRSLLEEDEKLGPIVRSQPEWDPRRFVGLAPEQTFSYLDDVVGQLPRPDEDHIRELNV